MSNFFRINGKKLTDGENWDFTLSEGQKRIAALFCFLLSGGVWLFFSTPNTLFLCAEYGKNVSILGSSFMGQVLGITAGLAFSIGEYVSILLIVWKRNILFVLSLVICMLVSIFATIKYTDVGNQYAQIAQDKISNQERVIRSIENNIKSDSSAIAGLQIEAKTYKNVEQKTPNWIHRRIRQANERTLVNTKRLESAIKSLSEVKDEIGVQVSIGNDSNKWISWVLSILLEGVIVFFGFVAIGIYKTDIKLEKNELQQQQIADDGKVLVDNGQMRLVNYGDSVDNVNKSQKPDVNHDRLVKQNYDADIRPIDKKFGFQTRQNENEKSSEDNIQDNSNLSSKTFKSVRADKIGQFKDDLKSFEEKKSGHSLNDILNRFKGKTDDFILYVWDNWNTITNSKRSYRNLATETSRYLRDINSPKKSVSKSYCFDVINKRKRGNNDNVVQKT